MTGTTTPRIALYKPDGADNVNVVTDINNNMDKLDSAVGMAVASALPSTPYSGKIAAVTTDSNRSYFWTGSAWVELLNSTGTFGSDIKLNGSNKLVIGNDVNLYRSAANVLKTDDSLVVVGSLTAGGLPMAMGVTTSGSATTNTTTTLTDVTGLSVSVTSGAIYRFEAFLKFRVSINTLIPQFTINGPASPTFINYMTQYQLSSGHGHVAQLFDGLQQVATSGSAVTTINTDMSVQMRGMIKPSATGTLQIQMAQQAAVGTLTAQSGAYILLRQVG